MATILYARVNSSEQTIDHQRTQAEKAGFRLDQVIWDEGVSGASTKLAERPQGRRLLDLLRNGETLVVRWVDRLGRNYRDICDTIREFMPRGVVIRTVINGIAFDGATPCSALSVTLSSPSWRQPHRLKRKPPKKHSALALPMQR
jgi:DNA invertase Pin-like site-specific DNA recombinase